MGINLSDWALRHRSLIVYLMIASVIAGAWSYPRLGRDEDPPFTIKTMVVSTQWPGADLNDTLSQVTDRLEKKLEEVPGLDHLKSYTRPGESVIFVELRESTAPGDVPDLWYQVRKKVSDVRANLPAGVLGPFFDDEFGDTFGIIWAFTADGFSRRELRDAVEDVRTRLLRVPDVSKINLLGAQDEKIWLEFSPRKLAGMGLRPADVLAALAEQNAVVPAGVVDTGVERIPVRVSGAFASEEALRGVTLAVNGRFLRLLDVVDIRRGIQDPPAPLFRHGGEPAIGLAISMEKGGDILAFGRNLRAAMAEAVVALPVGIDAHQVADQPAVVDHAVHGFLKSLAEAVAIVLAVSFLSVGLRAGLVVAVSIPLVLAMTFAGMELAGIGLHRVSLGALIIGLGLLVDDAMITVEMMIHRLEKGDGITAAATHAFTTTAFPMLTGTLVTVAGFLPVGFARSASGEYCFSLFAVIGIALVASWLVAVLFAPLLGVWILPGGGRAHAHDGEGRMARLFRPVLVGCLRRRWWVIAGTLAVFGLAMAGATRLEEEFFPTSERPELLVNLTLPRNAAQSASEEQAKRLEAILAKDPDVARFSVYVGQGSVRFYLPMDVQLTNPNLVQAVVVAREAALRGAVRDRLERALAADFPDVLARVQSLEMGPPVGWPVKYRVAAADPGRARDAAFRVAGAIGSDPAIRNVNFDWSEPARVLRVGIQQDKARRLGLSSSDIAKALDMVVSGASATQVRDDVYLIDVTARAGAADRKGLDALRNLQLSVPDGRAIPLSDVATFTYAVEQPIVWRRDRLPTVTVQADLAPGVQAATVAARLQPALERARAGMAPDVRIEIGGTVEESAKGRDSVFAQAPLMLIVMLTLLMVQLRGFQRLALVLSVAPLGMIGVVAAMLPFGMPVGFIAILGIIALIGMIVRNSVILIDQIQRNDDAGMDRWTAVVEASLQRMRPILLTAAAAILGMVPIAREAFWGPMAFAVMGGLTVATALTLVFLPALYAAWFRIREPAAPT